MTARRIVALTLVTVSLLGACGGTATNVSTIKLVSATDAAAVLDERAPDVVLLDVRTPEEFNEIRVPGSVNIDFYAVDFAAQLDSLAKDVPYVVYCRSGNRSSSAVEVMRDLGFAEVWDVDGGIIAWSESNLPLSQ